MSTPGIDVEEQSLSNSLPPEPPVCCQDCQKSRTFCPNEVKRCAKGCDYCQPCADRVKRPFLTAYRLLERKQAGR